MRLSLVDKIQNYSIDHPRIILVITALLTLLFAFFLFRVEVNSDLQSFLPEEERTYALKAEEGGDTPAKLLVLSAERRDNFSLEGLKVLQEAYNEILEIPGVNPGITPFNLFMFQYENRRIGIAPLSPGGLPPKEEKELEQFLHSIVNSDIADKMVISPDKKVLFAYFQLDKEIEVTGAMKRLSEILPSLDPYFDVHITGSIPIDTRFSLLLKRNFSVLLTLALIIIAVFFYFGFHSAKGVLLPFVVVSLGTLWSLGFMGIVGFKLTLMSIIIPPLVLTLGSSYAIHILNHFYFHDDEPADSIRPFDFSHINRTVLLASFTTMIGFLSLMTTGNVITTQFALTGTFGIFSSALLALFFLPAALRIFNKKETKYKDQSLDWFFRVVSSIPKVINRKYRIFILFLAVLPIIFILSLNLLDFNTDPMNYFPKRDPVIKDMRYFTDKIGGFDYVYITFKSEKEERGAFLDPSILKSLFALELKLRENSDVCDTLSFTSLLAELNRTMEGSYEIPENRGAILLLSRYISLYTKNSASLYFDSLADDSYSEITFALRVYNSNKKSFLDEIQLRKILAEIETLLPEYLPEGVTYTIWGKSLKYLSLSDLFKENLGFSIGAALISIALVVFISFASIKYTLLALIPLICGILTNFILMAFAGIPLDMTTSMVFSIAIGVGIDDAIHFLLQYRRQKALHPKDPQKVLENTLVITGRPIILTSLSIIAGFLILLLASFKPIGFFGVLVVFILFASTAGTLLFLPSVIKLFSKEIKN